MSFPKIHKINVSGGLAFLLSEGEMGIGKDLNPYFQTLDAVIISI